MLLENTEWWVWAVVGLQALILLVLAWLSLRRPPVSEAELAHRQSMTSGLQQQTLRIERVEGALRREMGDNAREARQEFQQALEAFRPLSHGRVRRPSERRMPSWTGSRSS
ncbi:MAG: hypothetical protein R3E56_10225 [Burkholderiaceae bacterium]